MNQPGLPFDHVLKLPATEAIGEIIWPITADMTKVRPGFWVKPLSDEHLAVMTATAYGSGGAEYELEWGVSLSWMPHRVARAWKWHRTIAQARRDLFIDHFTPDHPPKVAIGAFRGVEALRAQAEAAWPSAYAHASAWWESVSTAAGVLAEAQRQEGMEPVQHDPAPELVTAFTLARLGRIDEAHAKLAELAEDQQYLSKDDEAHLVARMAELQTLGK